MPAQKKGFFRRYGDKVLCACVFCVLVVAAYFAYTLSRVSESADPRAAVKEWAAKSGQVGSTPSQEPTETEDFLQEWTRRNALVEPEAMRRPSPMWWALPRIYPPVRVGFAREVKLSFAEPIEEGSFIVKDGANIAGLVEIEHPHNLNYAEAVLKIPNLPVESKVAFKVEGRAGERKHIQPVVVSEEYGKRAYPPIKVSAAAGLGRVTLAFEPDPKNEEQEVEVAYYAVFRQPARDPVQEFEMVGGLPAGQSGTRGPAVRGYEGMEGMYDPGRGGKGPAPEGGTKLAPTGAARTTALQWTDFDVEPGETYLYKVQVYASEAQPSWSEFTDVLEATVPNNVEFRFSRGSPGRSVTFEVAKTFGRVVRTTEFRVDIGEQIGGVQERGARIGARDELSFWTGCYLLDYHPRVVRKETVTTTFGESKRTSVSSRIIYVDRRGNVRVRWKDESPPEIWEAVRTGAGLGMLPGGGPPRYP